jgi:protein-S-isoprenylcysteine O-methyltransferase Ste14
MGWARRIIPPGWLLLALLAAGALHQWLPLGQMLRPPLTWLGLVPLGAGLVVTSKGFGAFRRAGTPVIPFSRSTALVTTGVYRLTRNPMYLGITLILGGVAWLLGSCGAFLPLLPLALILEHGYIRAEERFLEEIFGSEYLRYKSEVRRWL